MYSSRFQAHVNVHRYIRTDDAAACCSLQQAQIGKNANILMNPFHITANGTGQLPNGKFTFALCRTRNIPSLLRKLPKK